MTSLFITLTLPASGIGDERPVFINCFHVHQVEPAIRRKDGAEGGGKEAYEVRGTYITIGSGQDSTIWVTEEYSDVTKKITEAMK